MNLEILVDDAVTRIDEAVAATLTVQETAAISKIVNDTLVRAVGATTQSYSDVVVSCCGPEADMAHKINEEVERARIALVANLMGMR